MPGRSRVTTSDSRTDRCGIQAYRRMEVRAASTDDCRPRDTVGPSTVRVVAHNGADKNFQESAGIFRASLEICGVSGKNRLQRRKSEKRLGGGYYPDPAGELTAFSRIVAGGERAHLLKNDIPAMVCALSVIQVKDLLAAAVRRRR